ncbi:MAG: hypothetical protein FJX48_04710 [Alphaproteobacteria bacterium]|nr:hypothetical protein [Alphaproteobacteria bacterium]
MFESGFRTPGARRARVFGAAALIAIGGVSASAQIVLPGAVAPSPEGTVAGAAKNKSAGGGEMGAAAGPAIMPKAPAEDAIVGKTLKLDGEGSAIEFSRAGAILQVAKLTLVGDDLRRSGETCRVEVAGTPLKLSARESDTGLRRYQVAFPACPFSFTVLDGAILVTNEGKACELKEAGCRADPEGLWGMGADEIDPKKGEEMLGARARVEKTVRNTFRELYERNKKEKPIRNYLVKEQAGFSSWREEVCRSYAREPDFGYCALRLTEARAIALGAQLAAGVKLPPGVAEELAAENAKKDVKK